MGVRVLGSSATVDDVKTADAIVLTEGCEGEVFPEQPGRIPLSRLYELDVVFVDCGGFAKVARKYDELCASGLKERLIPTFDQDITEIDKEPGRSVWASPSKYVFYPNFEEEFPDWALAKAIERCERHFPIPEDIVAQARKGRRSEKDFYKAIERLGGELHQGLRMPSKRELARALRDILVHFYYATPNIKRWADRIIEVSSRNRQLQVLPRQRSMRWDVVRYVDLRGALIYIEQTNGNLRFLNFGSERCEPIGVSTENVKPSIMPMWSPDGEKIAFTGKQGNSTVVAVLTVSDGLHEYVINQGDPIRPTSLSDWDPREKDSNHLFIHGPDPNRGNQYRLWRAYYDGHRAIHPVEPFVRGRFSFRRHRNWCIAIGLGDDKVKVFRLKEAAIAEELKDGSGQSSGHCLELRLAQFAICIRPDDHSGA